MLGLFVMSLVIHQYMANSSVDLEGVDRKVAVLMKQFSVLNDELNMVKQKLAITYDENQTLKQSILLVSKKNVELNYRVNKLSDQDKIVNEVIKHLLEERDASDGLTSEGHGKNEKAKSYSTERRLSKINDLNHDVTQRYDKQKRFQQPADLAVASKVAFSVGLTHSFQLGYHQVVEYNKVYTNVGYAYDTRHSHFIAPTRGVYLLSFTVMNIKGEVLYLQMVKNSVPIAVVYGGQSEYSMGSETTVHLLAKGDVVWVRHTHGGTPTINGRDSFNTFSGALLFEI